MAQEPKKFDKFLEKQLDQSAFNEIAKRIVKLLALYKKDEINDGQFLDRIINMFFVDKPV